MSPLVDTTDEPFIEGAGATQGGVEHYMYNKIRILLSNIYSKHGYPARAHHTVQFYGLLMFSVPINTKIHYINTKKAWEQIVYLDDKEGQPILTEPKDWKWRQVYIYDIPDEIMQKVMHFIPLSIDDGIVWTLLELTTMRPWQLFDNLITYGGINDIVIEHNWDKIKDVLNQNGY